MLSGVSATTYPTTVRCEGGTDWAAWMLSGVSPVSGILWRRLGRKPRLAQVQRGGGGLYHDAIQQFFGGLHGQQLAGRRQIQAQLRQHPMVLRHHKPRGLEHLNI